jgi:hypothetical protein
MTVLDTIFHSFEVFLLLLNPNFAAKSADIIRIYNIFKYN